MLHRHLELVAVCSSHGYLLELVGLEVAFQ